MSGRQFVDNSDLPNVILRSPPNWTAVAFFGALGALHLGIATSALFASRWEAHMSVIFGSVFTFVGVACLFVRHEIIIRPERRRITIRTGLGRVAVERSIPFSDVTSVRITLLGVHQRESSVVIVCAREDIEIPPCDTPRQQALVLAMALGVRLVKVYGENSVPESSERMQQMFRNEDAA
jgi:hypothetical protein